MAALEAANTEASALDVAAPHDRRRQVTKAVPGGFIHRRRLVNEEGRELTPSEPAMRRARRRRFKTSSAARDHKHRMALLHGRAHGLLS